LTIPSAWVIIVLSRVKEKVMINYSGYKIDGSKADEFRADAVKLFGDENIKNELQARMVNIDRETMSFDLDVRGNCPKEIFELAVKYGVGFNSYE
jgi:hypothetical protein